MAVDTHRVKLAGFTVISAVAAGLVPGWFGIASAAVDPGRVTRADFTYQCAGYEGTGPAITAGVDVTSPAQVAVGEEFTVKLAPRPMNPLNNANALVGGLHFDFAVPTGASIVGTPTLADAGEKLSGTAAEVIRVGTNGQADPKGPIIRIVGKGNLAAWNSAKDDWNQNNNLRGTGQFRLPAVQVKLRAEAKGEVTTALRSGYDASNHVLGLAYSNGKSTRAYCSPTASSTVLSRTAVVGRPTAIQIETPTPIVAGESAKSTIRLPEMTDGRVTVEASGRVETLLVRGGTATWTHTFPAASGAVPVTLTSTGDTRVAPVTQTVNLRVLSRTDTQLSSDASMVRAKVTGRSGGVPTGAVEFYRGDTLIGQTALIGGVATLSNPPESGTGALRARYLGAGLYLGSESESSIPLAAAFRAGSDSTVDVAISTPSGPFGSSAAVWIDGKQVDSALVSGGVAVLRGVAVRGDGPHQVEVSYKSGGVVQAKTVVGVVVVSGGVVSEVPATSSSAAWLLGKLGDPGTPAGGGPGTSGGFGNILGSLGNFGS